MKLLERVTVFTCTCDIYENVEDQLMREFFEFCTGTVLTNGKLFYNFLIFSIDSYQLKLRCLTLACAYYKKIELFSAINQPERWIKKT